MELKQLKLLEHNRPVFAARFSPCGRFAFAGDLHAGVVRWDVTKDDNPKTVLTGHSGWVQAMCFHPDGKTLFTADSWGQVHCWDYAADNPTPRWTRKDTHPNWVRAMALSPDGSTLATCGADRFVRLWSAADGSPKADLPKHADDLFTLAFHPDGKSLAFGDLKGVVTHWDLQAGKAARQLDARVLYLRPIVNGFAEINDVGGVRSLSFDPSGATLAAAGSKPETSGFFTGKPTVVLIDWAAGTTKQVLQPQDATPDDGIAMDAVWHPQGFVMACSSGQAGKGAFWCWKPGEAAPFLVNKELTHARSSSLSPDGARLLIARVTAPQNGAITGNGRRAGKDEEYYGLVSQVHVFAV